MTALDQLQILVSKVARGLALEMATAKTDQDVLPIDNITVEKTADGVTVKFVQKPALKKSPRPVKGGDES